MNTMIKIAAGFVIGATIGSLVTYFVTRDSFQTMADEQIENMRQYYLEHPPKERKLKNEKKPEGEKPENKGEPWTSEKKNYEEMAQKYRSSHDFPKDDLADRLTESSSEDGSITVVELKKEDRREKPYLIQEEDYMRKYGIFGSEALDYWVNDNILTVGDSAEVLDVLSTIGIDAVNALLDPMRTSDVVYVRNERLEMEYEVERVDQSYQEWIGGPVDFSDFNDENEEEEKDSNPPTQPPTKKRRNKYED